MGSIEVLSLVVIVLPYAFGVAVLAAFVHSCTKAEKENA
jgi:hypothetical protein